MFVPDDFDVSRSFDGPGFRLEPLGPEHNERDHEAWMSSIDHIRSTPGMDAWDGQWPVPMTLEDNLVDLVRHRDEFEVREAFAYSVLDGDDVIGCLYINPVTDHAAEAYVMSWVTAARSEMDATVWEAVCDWLASDWPFTRITYASRR